MRNYNVVDVAFLRSNKYPDKSNLTPEVVDVEAVVDGGAAILPVNDMSMGTLILTDCFWSH